MISIYLSFPWNRYQRSTEKRVILNVRRSAAKNEFRSDTAGEFWTAIPSQRRGVPTSTAALCDAILLCGASGAGHYPRFRGAIFTTPTTWLCLVQRADGLWCSSSRANARLICRPTTGTLYVWSATGGVLRASSATARYTSTIRTGYPPAPQT